MAAAARSVYDRITSGQFSVFLRFVAVGVLNTAFGYGVFSILVWFGVLPELALLISTIVGVLFNFATTGSLVFRNSDRSLFLRFALVYTVIYLLNAAALRGLLWMGVSPFLAQAGIMPFSVVLTFFAMRRFVFQDPMR